MKNIIRNINSINQLTYPFQFEEFFLRKIVAEANAIELEFEEHFSMIFRRTRIFVVVEGCVFIWFGIGKYATDLHFFFFK